MKIFDSLRFNYGLGIAVLICVSLILRLVLIFKEGQVVHGDGEEYFGHSQVVYNYLVHWDFKNIFMHPVAHWGGVLLGSIPFFVTFDQIDQEKISAAFFAIPEVINVFLVYQIALKFGFERRAAFISTFLYTFSFTTIYLTRFVLLHGMSTLFFLLSIRCLLSTTERKNKNTLLSASGFFLVFFIYYGYWTLALIGLLFSTFYRAESLKQIIVNGLICTLGFWAPFFIIWCASTYAHGLFLRELSDIYGLINQGSYNEGHSLPFVFLFHTEGFLFFVWMSCLVFAGNKLKDERIRYLGAGIVIVYTLWVLGANYFHQFVVLGRLVRQLTPLFCLLSGLILADIKSEKLINMLLFGVCVVFLFNYQQLYHIKFDREFEIMIDKYRKSLPSDRELKRVAICVPHHSECELPPEGCTLALSNSPHLVNYKYFQYEVLTPEVREKLNGTRMYDQIFDCPKAVSTAPNHSS